MTKKEALEIQRKQIEYYAHLYPGLAEKVAAITTADKLEDGVEYDIITINKHIPRGGAFERIMCFDFGGN